MRETPPVGYSLAADGLRIMRQLDAPQEDIEAAEAVVAAEQRDEDFDVHEDNWLTVLFFCRLTTQWQYQSVGGGGAAGVGGAVIHPVEALRIGLRYDGVEAAMRLMAVAARKRAALFDELQQMEAAVLDADDELRQQRRN